MNTKFFVCLFSIISCFITRHTGSHLFKLYKLQNDRDKQKCRPLGLVNIIKMYFSDCLLASGLFVKGKKCRTSRAETFDSLAVEQHYVFPVSKSKHAKLMNCILFGNALYGTWYIAFQVLFCLSQKSHCCHFCSALHFLMRRWANESETQACAIDAMQILPQFCKQKPNGSFRFKRLTLVTLVWISFGPDAFFKAHLRLSEKLSSESHSSETLGLVCLCLTAYLGRFHQAETDVRKTSSLFETGNIYWGEISS